MHFPLDRNGLAKSRTRFGLLNSSAEIEDQWVTFRFGCIGNCEIRGMSKVFPIGGPANWGWEQIGRKTHGCVLRSPCRDICGENASFALIDSSWRRWRREWLVISCSFSGGWNLPFATSALCRVAHNRRYRPTSVCETAGVLETI